MRQVTQMCRALLVAVLAVWVMFGAPAAAQEAGADVVPNYEEWSGTATRAETALENGRASTAALETLRTQLAQFRERFLAAQSINAARIETLRTQIAALGPVPEEGASEDPDIAGRRADLNAQLERLLAPVRRAEEAFTRADGLIGEIDVTIRERQSEELFSMGPTPVNPAYWGPAFTDLSMSLSTIGRDAQKAWASEAQREEMRANIPQILFYLVIALAFVLRGRVWIARASGYVAEHSRRGLEIWATLVSFGGIIVPLIGLYALTEAIFATGLVGLRAAHLLDFVPLWGAIILVARWLGDRIFNRNSELALFAISGLQRAEARTYMTLLALLYVVHDFVAEIGVYDRYSPETMAVLVAPIIVATGLILFRAGALLIAAVRVAEEDGEERMLRGRVVQLLARAIVLVALAGPVLALVGYRAAAEGLVFPTILTLGLAAVVVVLHSLVREAFRAADKAHEGDGLAPVLVNFAITLLAMPPLSLIWGARVADLTELWSQFQAGFSIGETRVSPSDFLTFVLVFVIGYTITRLGQGALRSSVLPRTRIDTGGQNAIVSGLGYVGIFIAAIVAITTAGIDLSSLAIVAGALSVGIGFGLQTVVSNFVSGIILLIERPIAEGDWIEVGSYMGIVKNISVRSTRIETFDRTDVIVPNADLISGSVINWTRGSQVGRVLIPVGVAYGSDTRKVEGILREIVEAHPMVLLNPAPGVDFMGFGADALDFRVRAIIRDINSLVAVRTDLNHEIAKRFQDENIEIPFAQRDIWVRNADALTGALSEPGKNIPRHVDEDDVEAGTFHPSEGNPEGQS
ncbi:DUF3772 domain-containing protein [Pseudaestuariivita sp.]|uniref:DUF3772 domain-containing protein n=1 Tax=Pseudaestuariivita sp. TaxID=2211669 RepID=UPI004058DD3B